MAPTVLSQVVANALPRLGHVFQHDPVRGILCTPGHLAALGHFPMAFLQGYAFALHFEGKIRRRLGVPTGFLKSLGLAYSPTAASTSIPLTLPRSRQAPLATGGAFYFSGNAPTSRRSFCIPA